LAARNTPDVLPKEIPIFLSQGAADDLVRPDVTQDYMNRLCRAGNSVRMVMLPNVNHAFIARDSAGAAVNWMADRFNELHPPN
jgi:dipeptidyl aminopeptidase/acylaminoacyl peptidase